MALNKQTVLKQLEKLEGQRDFILSKKNTRVEAMEKKLSDFKVKIEEEKASKLAELDKKYNEFYEKHVTEKTAVMDGFENELKAVKNEISKYEKAKAIFEKQEDDLRKLLGESDEDQRA